MSQIKQINTVILLKFFFSRVSRANLFDGGLCVIISFDLKRVTQSPQKRGDSAKK
jgi:hypothetical protein